MKIALILVGLLLLVAIVFVLWAIGAYNKLVSLRENVRGEIGEGTGYQQILGNTLPDFRLTYGNNIQYKKLTLYGQLDGTYGNMINNQAEGCGLLDISSGYFDQGEATVETACTDGKDEDCNGLTDCLDPGCDADP